MRPSPLGAVGAGLAYGLALGALRRSAGGLFTRWATHVLTDLAIVSIVLTLAH